MSGVTPDLPTWAQWFAALAVPIAAAIGVALGFANYLLSLKKREDDIWDRRFDFYDRFRKYCWKEFRGKGFTPEEMRMSVPKEFPLFIAEASWLFDKRLAHDLKDAPWQDWPAIPDDFIDTMPMPEWLQGRFDRFLRRSWK